MSKQTDTSLFIVSSLPRFYQVLLGGIKDYKDLGSYIVKELKTAHAFRQVEKVAELSQILVNNPIKEYQLIGQYYLAWSKFRGAENQPRMLERVIEQSKTYKAKALSFRGALSFYKGNLDKAMFFYLESLKSGPTVSEYLLSVKEIAVIKSIEGFKETSLKDLERLLPLLKHAEPFSASDVLNSYAVELAEAGRKYEARNVIRYVLASPFIKAYPEWRETAEGLKGPNRSFVVIDPSRARKGKLLSMPVIEHTESVEQDKPARVLSLQDWKRKMGKDKPPEKLNEKQMVVKMMTMLTDDSVTDAQLSKIMAYIQKVMSEPDKSEPDEE